MYCGNCGKKVETTNKLICPNCGSRIKNDLKYCNNCGAHREHTKNNYCSFCKQKFNENLYIKKENYRSDTESVYGRHNSDYKSLSGVLIGLILLTLAFSKFYEDINATTGYISKTGQYISLSDIYSDIPFEILFMITGILIIYFSFKIYINKKRRK